LQLELAAEDTGISVTAIQRWDSKEQEAETMEDKPSGRISVTTDDVEIGTMIEAAKQRTTGAVVTFLGVVRDDGIESMELSAFEEVAVQDMTGIRDEAVRQFNLQQVDIVHRIGSLRVGENILLIVVAAGHRKEAFKGCEYILERIKERVPIWKKEFLADGHRWVEGKHG
jgi:molybdopterin synthase catalytic subunit